MPSGVDVPLLLKLSARINIPEYRCNLGCRVRRWSCHLSPGPIQSPIGSRVLRAADAALYNSQIYSHTHFLYFPFTLKMFMTLLTVHWCCAYRTETEVRTMMQLFAWSRALITDQSHVHATDFLHYIKLLTRLSVQNRKNNEYFQEYSES